MTIPGAKTMNCMLKRCFLVRNKCVQLLYCFCEIAKIIQWRWKGAVESKYICRCMCRGKRRELFNRPEFVNMCCNINRTQK